MVAVFLALVGHLLSYVPAAWIELQLVTRMQQTVEAHRLVVHRLRALEGEHVFRRADLHVRTWRGKLDKVVKASKACSFLG